MKILVTGASGYLGSLLVKAFLNEGHQVSILARGGSNLRRLQDLLPLISVHEIDRSSLSSAFKGEPRPDAVVHTATSYGRKDETASEIAEANLLFPLRLFEEASRWQVPVFFNTDTSLPRELNSYALSKKQFVEWGRQTARSNGIRFVNIVLEHFYGPGDDETKFPLHIIRSCLMNIPELRLTLGEQERDFIFIDDVIAAYLILLRNDPDGQTRFAEYGLGSGNPVSIRTFVETVHAMTGSTTALNFGALPYRENDVMVSDADTEHLQALGWSPSVRLEEGIRRIINHERATRDIPT